MERLKNVIFMISLAVISLQAAANVEHPHPPAKVPQIPTTKFTWDGTFRTNGRTVDEPPVTVPLTIRGKQQGDFFDVYMQQGGPKNREIWVENLIYQGDLYTITHTWNRPVPDRVLNTCFKSPEITVDDLNGILKASQLVGPEVINIDRKGGPELVNHFRSSCLSSIFFGLIKVNIFSDIYVPRGASYPWKRWLQFGDGVGLDRNNDEWFFFDSHKNKADPIELPAACAEDKVVVVEQGECSNLQQQP